ncbi:hypothetical protein HIM_09714 [Hirsutella minnesotensis 3608]|uniref:Enoyl reductase (ER) domain-containing protein n=1 Tax=Hirsutella minnesotensis 3608 TaxID=1043627 RepID=A0A0F7ZS78_9HYPO|nr:hypothetical protein HIM_09714 [Hirsutella minnesotensis 3608]
MGHEFVGEVVEAGVAVTTVRPGDKVVSPFTVSCGDCFYCKLQNSSRCVNCQVFGSNGLDGAQAEYVRVPLADSTVIKAPPGLSDDALILMADIFPTGFFGARNSIAGLGAQDPAEAVVVVIGCGPVGLCAIVSALEYRPRVVFAIDGVDSRLGLAEKLGARPLDLNKGLPSIMSAIQEVTEGRGADAVVEVVGQGPALRTAYDIIRPFGSISSIGAHHSAMPFSATDGYDKNVKLQMGRCPVRSIFEDALAVLAKCQHLFGFMFESKMPLNEAAVAYDLFDKMKVQKVIFGTPSSEERHEIV